MAITRMSYVQNIVYTSRCYRTQRRVHACEFMEFIADTLLRGVELDLRTKLCIRDSLYRLARSAEQRHNNPSLSSGATDINDLGGPLMAERTNKCTGFMDMETVTNPIDRSVAHLLFHRPSESSNLPSKLNVKHGPISGPSMMAEKLACQDEAAAESNNKIGGN
ncbi:LNK1-like protein isoform X1 [Tanacetum coccineum]